VEVLEPRQWPEWDAFLGTLPEARLRQTSHYADGLALYGWKPTIVVLRDSATPGSPILAGGLLGEKPLPLVGGIRLQLSGGLAVSPGATDAQAEQFLRELEIHARARGAAWIQLDWRRPVAIGEAPQPDGIASASLLDRLGYDRQDSPGTYFIELSGKDPDSLLASLGRQARQNIRHARRDGIEVVDERSPEGVQTFRDFHREMSSRKGLGTWPDGFEERVLLTAIRAGRASLLAARHQGRVINMILVSRVGAPLYEWGAIAPRGETSGVPPTGEFLHYEAMRGALGGPHPHYDLGGSPGPEPIAGHPNYTVWRFKKKLGGTYVSFVGEARRVLIPWKARAVDLLRKRSARG